MTVDSTGAMQQFGDRRSPERGRGDAGFVLLYADPSYGLPGAFPFREKPTVIGRDPGATLRLDVTAVSRIHAELRYHNGSWWIHDAGSRNGILADGIRTLAAELEPQQEVRIGDAIFKFVSHDADAYANYNLDGSMREGHARRAHLPSTLIGGYQMDLISAELERIAPTLLTVLVLGESGTGKEVVARQLHQQSRRRGGFVAVNCAAIPANLIESELFGYRKGAFSGADRDKPGLIRSADGGTLFLDEIGDMPLEAQTKLLRVLQAKEVLPVGATAPELVDVRVVCATHRDLSELQAKDSFRLDLYARINEYEVRLPALRERKEDIYMLVREFLKRGGAVGKQPSFPFMTALLHYDWPYNVRELEACIKRALALSDKDVLEESELPLAISEAMQDYGHPKTRGAERQPEAGQVERPSESELRALLVRHQGNVAAVGRELGKARMQVHRWARHYGLRLEDFRSSTQG